ncbi:MAG: DNA alkylation repair protein [Planctomycetota bacterium]|jgi:3-methyladenine DNA glycosylase AlkD
MSAITTAKEIVERLRNFTNPERQKNTVNYFPSAEENLGVAASDIRSVLRDNKKLMKAASPAAVLKLAHAIIAQKTLEGRQLAYELVGGHKATMAILNRKQLETLGKGIDNWASVDTFCCGIAGICWREGNITDAAISAWLKSKDPWWRRAGVVATIPLNIRSRGGTGDSARTTMVCEMIVDDDHVMVHKALSWALRQLIEWDRVAVKRFLKKHDATLPALVKREVTRKLETGLKNKKR